MNTHVAPELLEENARLRAEVERLRNLDDGWDEAEQHRARAERLAAVLRRILAGALVDLDRAALHDIEPAEPHSFEPCREADDGDVPGHNFTCALLCVVCGLPRERHTPANPADDPAADLQAMGAPAEGFFARGDDGHYHPDTAPAEEPKP